MQRQVEGTDRAFHYMVTAGHVIKGIKKKGISKVLLRYNLKNGEAGWHSTNASGWMSHPTDTTADVAVLPAPLPPDADHLFVPLTECVSDEVISTNAIGVGDEVFITGLFANHTGTRRNIPIVRAGNIAAMPEERVNSALGLMDAYLIEARSIGGLSGSPVFVHLGATRVIDKRVQPPPSGRIFYLLGVMHGHWDVGISVSGDVTADIPARERVNMGIALVTPIAKVLETIERPDNRDAEDRIEAEFRKTLRNAALSTPQASDVLPPS